MTPELWGELLGACNPSQRHTRLRTKALVDLMNDYTELLSALDAAEARVAELEETLDAQVKLEHRQYLRAEKAEAWAAGWRSAAR